MESGSGICAKRVVVVTKDILNGQPTAVVLTEQIAISGGLVRQKLKYMKFLRKRMNTQPSPAKIFWHNVRGLSAGSVELKVYEGIPPPYD